MRPPHLGIGPALVGLLAVHGVIQGVGGAAEEDEMINPYPRETIHEERLRRWDFGAGPEGWRAVNQSKLSAGAGVLRITSTGVDPYVHAPAVRLDGVSLVALGMTCSAGGGGQVFWTTADSPGWDEKKSGRFRLEHDGQPHEYRVPVDVGGTLTGLRLDPGTAPGEIEIDWVEVWRGTLHPLEIERVETDGAVLAAHVRNHSDKPVGCKVSGRAVTVEPRSALRVAVDASGDAPFQAVAVAVEAEGLPALRRLVFLHRPRAETDWAVLRSPALTLKAARDGSGARLEAGGRLAAVIAPLVKIDGADGAVPSLELEEDGDSLRFVGDGTAVSLALEDDEVAVSIRSDRPCEGPVLRAQGPLEQGLLAGLEYLGKGESSSSKNDIETAERLRYAPDPLKVTMPLMACVTDRAATALLWEDTSLRPVYAAPNFFDGSADHRMALRGTRIEATILCRSVPPPGEAFGDVGTPLDDVILWAVKRRGLPPVPEPPRSREAQWALCTKALEGPLRTEKGWGHCAEPRWDRHWFADHASTIWRLTGEVPDVPALVPGGAHVRNDALYFVTGRALSAAQGGARRTGRAREWLRVRRDEAEGIMRGQKPDGSFRYAGKYLRGHFEDTASGHCARPAWTLLEFARLTGDERALQAGVKALEYMKRFRTPRGAQTWELSLHTPDILASAYLVLAYVRGYELTGKREYLARARSWALSGVPFVYQWERYPVMLYATVPVYGATNWRAPNWIGLPVQWCGGVYAYALAELAPHDPPEEGTLDWRRLARGILVAGEKMQHADGPLVGCLPDAWDLPSQTPRPWTINPCALVSLRLALDGELDSLAVAADGKHRAVAPFPVTLRRGRARVRARRGVAYQVLIDGERIVDIESRGTDVIRLE